MEASTQFHTTHSFPVPVSVSVLANANAPSFWYRCSGAFPLYDSDSYSDYCTDSDSMQKCSTGTDSYGDSYANHGHFTSLFEN